MRFPAGTDRGINLKSVNHKRIIVIIICLIIYMNTGQSLVSAAEGPGEKVVRVGVIELPGYFECGENGEYSGYGYDYLKEIAQYTGWTYEFVESTWEGCQNMMREGSIDLLSPMIRSRGREQEFNFSRHSIGSTYLILSADGRNSGFSFEDFDGFDGKRVGYLAGAYGLDSLRAYEEKHHFTLTEQKFEEPDRMNEALKDGEIDLIFSMELRKTNDQQIVAAFEIRSFYIAGAKEDSTLMEELNNALDRIYFANPEFESGLYKRHYGKDRNARPVFSRKEKNYLREHPVMRIAYDPAWYPMEEYDEKSGQAVGISRDMFDIISDYTGMRFEYVQSQDYASALEALRRGEADLLTSFANDYNWADLQQVKMSSAYTELPAALVSADGVEKLDGMRVAVPKQYFFAYQLSRLYPDVEVKEYANSEECVKAVRNKEADVACIDAYAADYLLDEIPYCNMKKTNYSEFSLPLCAAVSRDSDPLLLGIINKCIYYISPEEWSEIVIANTVRGDKMTARELMYRHPEMVLLSFGIPLLLIIACLIAMNFQKSRANKRITQLLYKDEVTGYGNYNKFAQDLKQMLPLAEYKYALIYLDIDNFKYINDAFGYEMGNETLRVVADIIQGSMAQGELSARIFADNFVMLVRFDGEEHLEQRVQKIKDEARQFMDGLGVAYRLMVSCGVYVVDSDSTSVDRLVNKSRYANEQAKQRSGHGVVYYHEDLLRRMKREKQLEALMDQALEEKQFVPYYQAQYYAADARLAGAEALVRWQHPERGMIQPGEFIPLFEKNGFIVKLDLYMFDCVCQQMQQWIGRGIQICPVACNFSRLHLYNEGFPDQLKQTAERYGISPSFLIIEITESVAMKNMDIFRTCTEKLRSYGFIISIDDFGTGYSSLGVLKNLTIDELKLDRIFQSGEFITEKDKVLIEMIIEAAHKLNLKVVCEGVETREQVEYMRQIGCDIIQGFYYAKPEKTLYPDV